MLKSIFNWLSKKPQTKASYITAFATLILVCITTIAVYVAIRESSLNRKIAKQVEAEKIVLQFHGGTVCRDYETSFSTFKSLGGAKKTVVNSFWPIVISNNGHNTVSLIAYSATSRIHGRKRNIETRFWDSDISPTSLPVVIKSGSSVKLFLVLPIHIPASVYKLVENIPQFSATFTMRELANHLQDHHDIDFYGNECRYAEKYMGAGKDRVAVHVFTYNEDGTLRGTSMQADQVTLEFKTSRGNYFTARALYYDTPAFRPPRTIYLPRGKPARVKFKLEGMDALPGAEDSNDKK